MQTANGPEPAQAAELNQAKSRLLCMTFFPELKRDNPNHPEDSYLTPSFSLSCITDD